MKTDYLIIGQGISGTLLSWFLHRAGCHCIVIDDGDPTAASRVASGIINPVTGRRIVQTWMIDTLMPFAFDAYKKLGAELGIEAITQKKVIDFFPSPQMLIAFKERVAEQAPYLSLPGSINSAAATDQYSNHFNYDFGFGEIAPCYAVNLATLLPAWKDILIQNSQFVNTQFAVEKLIINSDHVRYEEIEAEKIIFCDGAASAENPWFRNLPFALNKGEALIIRSEELPADKIFKKALTLVPMDNHLFWVGSSYEWNFEHADPTDLFRQKTVGILKHWLKATFSVEDHLASVRPATIERRPFVGVHPHLPRVAILNGMGTKGCSLAPYFADAMVNHLVHGVPLLPEADVNRFRRILQP